MAERGNIRIFLLVTLCLVVIGFIILVWMNNLGYRDILPRDDDSILLVRQPEDTLTREVVLYTGAEEGGWRVLTREIATPSPHIEERIKGVIDVLLEESSGQTYTPFPKGAHLMRVFMDRNEVAYLDFSDELKTNHPGGTWGELVTIYSLVNTVMENFKTVKGVKLLLMGNEIETLKGHIDTRYPLSFREQP
ncbi:MAG: GerMN domain-containing protein [bacterium]